MEQARNTYSREELLERLCEPIGLLTTEELAAAEGMAGKDSDVALALKHCRAMSGMTDLSIYGQPPSSDAQFLVTLRERLSETAQPSSSRAAFGTGRVAVALATVCAVVLVVIFAAGNRFTPSVASMQPQEAAALETLASAIEPAATIVPDTVNDQSVDAESLAVYLDMPDLASNWSFDTESDQPLSDELLGLDTQTLQEVLNDLDKTNFF